MEQLYEMVGKVILYGGGVQQFLLLFLSFLELLGWKINLKRTWSS